MKNFIKMPEARKAEILALTGFWHFKQSNLPSQAYRYCPASFIAFWYPTSYASYPAFVKIWLDALFSAFT